MELCPPLHLGVVAIEKGAFGSPSTKVANFTYFWINIINWNHMIVYKLLALDRNTWYHITVCKQITIIG